MRFWLSFVLLALPASSNTCKVVPGGGNYSATATWTGCGGTIPQIGDDVVMDATSGNLFIDANIAPNAPQSWNMTGYTGTLSGALYGVSLKPGISVAVNLGGTITANADFQVLPTANNLTTTFNPNSVSVPSALDFAGTATGGSVIITGNLTVGGTTHHLDLQAGDMHVDGATDNGSFSHTLGSLYFQPNGSGTLYLGHSVISLIGSDASNSAFSQGTGTPTLNAGASWITVVGSVFSKSTGAGLTHIVVSSGTAVATLTACNPACFWVGAPLTVSGGAAPNLNGSYVATAAAINSVTFQTTASNGTYNDAALKVSTTSKQWSVTVGTPQFNVVQLQGDLSVSGNHRFNQLLLNNAGQPNGLQLTAGSTQTVAAFSTNGSAGSLAKVASLTTSTATLATTGTGRVCVDYMSFTWITATPASTWHVGVNSTNGGNNSGLIFNPCQAIPAPIALGM